MGKFHSFVNVVALSLSLSGRVFGAIGPVTDLTISNADVTPDGITRAAVLAGGVFPGPLITGNKGDEFQINVIDNLTNETMLKSTTIHWHGIFQAGTNWADGAAFVNQCPIATGNSFLYDFTVPDQAGTFWYHSHLSTQYCDGLRGPLVVYDPDDANASLYDVDDDTTVITLADWYHTAAKLGPAFPAGPDSVLINGLGRFSGDGGGATNLTVITVTQGKRYRFRLVSISCDPNFTFSIDGHNMTIIEVGGVNHEALDVDSIQIFAGQRYSFILNANQSIDNYWIRAIPNTGTTDTTGGVNSAILRYDTAEEIEPTTNATTSVIPLTETDLVPLDNPAAPGDPQVGGVDLAMSLDFSFNGSNFFINNETFVPPTVPVLLQILSGAQDAASLLPNGSVYTLPSNSTIEISFPIITTDGALNAPGAPHPFHLHGHTFSVVRSAGSSTFNYANPVRRDTVSTGNSGDNVTIRFTTDNPGPWFLHCHIDFHLDAGFAIVFAEDTADTASANPVPTAWSDLCPTYDALDSSDL
uniref:Laccase-5 n=1 Tax=Trametes versicolor TaxID=5325 RepID=LAC5_TRAVE|nr:RecName: Full=Laccase-5; AltName: Full=Benzenediol:oxygen oxidoreductase 5; AltName: Full=Diphenol oxidase 5; AltName: Full=Laccase IV; AltName: Full=Urishiol oxidase 5; Flags: Precursor [Trametes versicolor]AAC49829.1 laccase IV [Trametes versicolor]